jgi:hypothetical protein
MRNYANIIIRKNFHVIDMDKKNDEKFFEIKKNLSYGLEVF